MGFKAYMESAAPSDITELKQPIPNWSNSHFTEEDQERDWVQK